VILDAGSEPQANQTYAIGFDYEPRDWPRRPE
jgi:hypothetical protein